MGVGFDFRKYFEAPVKIELNRIEIIVLIGNVILALRHPENKGKSSVMARDLARSLAEKLKVGDVLPIDGDVREEWKKEGII